MLMHVPDAAEPFDPGRLRSTDRSERRAKLRVHELSLGGLRLPDFDDDELVPSLSGDVTQHARRPVLCVRRAVPSEMTVDASVDLDRSRRRELNDDDLGHDAPSQQTGVVRPDWPSVG